MPVRLTALSVWIGLIAGCAAPVPPDRSGTQRPAEGSGRFEAVLLGSVQDGGLPHLGCTRPCCVSARREGRRLLPVSLGVIDRQADRLLLIEATPAVEEQVSRLWAAAGSPRDGRRPVDALLLTHAHIGHYSGLVHFGREVAATDALATWVSPRMADYLAGNGPWSQLVDLREIELRTFEPGVPFEPLPGLEVTAVSVPHRNEFADTVAFRLRGSRRTLLFLPDIDRWEDDVLDSLFDGVDLAWVDGTFYDGRELPGRDMSEIPHPPIVRTLGLLGRLPASLELRLIHLNHTNPALSDAAIRHEIERRGARIAVEGERVGF